MSPCLQCGACCAPYRVSFYRGEVLGTDNAVPDELVEEVTPFRVAMRGTLHAPVRCEALEGVIGGACRCTIYERRPSPCQEVLPSWQDGTPDSHCDQARAKHGLPPLTLADWIAPALETPRSERLIARPQRAVEAIIKPRRRRQRRSR